jgi:hypothetical protein
MNNKEVAELISKTLIDILPDTRIVYNNHSGYKSITIYTTNDIYYIYNRSLFRALVENTEIEIPTDTIIMMDDYLEDIYGNLFLHQFYMGTLNGDYLEVLIDVYDDDELVEYHMNDDETFSEFIDRVSNKIKE